MALHFTTDASSHSVPVGVEYTEMALNYPLRTYINYL